MPDNPVPYSERLKKGILRVEQKGSGGADEEAIEPLHRSLERTLARQAPGNTLAPAAFRLQITGAKPLLFQGKEALPIEPTKLVQLLNAIDVLLQPGEALELDGNLAAWLIRGEANITESNLRQADIALRTLNTKHGRDRDHVAAQQAESTKIRLRSRLTVLVSAMQIAQKDSEGPPSGSLVPAAPSIPEAAPAPKAPPPPPPPPPAAKVVEAPATPEVLAKALRKILAAIEGSGFKAAAIGDLGHQAWGSKRAALKIELLVSTTASQRDTLLGAARGEGLQQKPGGSPLQLRYTDAKLGCSADVQLSEAGLPFLKQVLTRAQPGDVFGVQVSVPTCDDLILLRVGSDAPADRDSVIELLRGAAGRIDGPYLKKEAEAAGLFDQLKSAWQQAKQQG